MASTGDKITDVRNAARPNSARVSSGRSAGGATLACDNLTGWPTASKVHFVTYTIDSNSDPVAGTQLDCYGIVSGNNIGSFTVVDGTDTGNSVNDVVEMLPTAAWGQDLADALTSQHSRTGSHTAITPTSISNSGVLAQTGVATFAANPVFPANSIAAAALVGVDKSLVTTDSNPYKFSAYRNAAWTSANGADGKVAFDTELFDTNNNFDAVTNNRYTAPVAGFYLFTARAGASITSGNYVILSIYKNGSIIQGGPALVSGATVDQALNGAWFLQLAATDYVEIFFRGTGAAGDTGATNTFFTGYLISRT